MLKTRKNFFWSWENSKHLHEIERNIDTVSYSMLENCLFSAVKWTKHVDIDLYKCSRYGIEFDGKGFFSFGDDIGRNVIIFGVDMNLSPHIDNKKKDILILGKGPAQRLENTLAAEKQYSINLETQ